MKTTPSFRLQQKKFPRVQEAYLSVLPVWKSYFDSLSVPWHSFNLLLAGYKAEKKLEVYLASNAKGPYVLLKSYDFCLLSGQLGPKRREGDKQVPEGFYHISRFNPVSNFHLSLQLNYPNSSDRILSDQRFPGSEIYIHGGCESVGCIPITHPGIEELYVLCVEAVEHGQRKIPVYLFPFSMTEQNVKAYSISNQGDSLLAGFWKNLQAGYRQWDSLRKPLKFNVDKKGEYLFR